jgi:hypothetical protein
MIGYVEMQCCPHTQNESDKTCREDIKCASFIWSASPLSCCVVFRRSKRLPHIADLSSKCCDVDQAETMWEDMRRNFLEVRLTCMCSHDLRLIGYVASDYPLFSACLDILGFNLRDSVVSAYALSSICNIA